MGGEGSDWSVCMEKSNENVTKSLWISLFDDISRIFIPDLLKNNVNYLSGFFAFPTFAARFFQKKFFRSLGLKSMGKVSEKECRTI